MRGRTKVTNEAAAIQYVRDSAGGPLDLRELFPRVASLELDLGCGDGSFLSALAAEHPERNFLGVERLVGRVGSACRKIAARHLTNARILRVDIHDAVTALIPSASVEVCHVMFPDPWPKRRHSPRRTVTAEFLRQVSRILVPSGLVRLTTDDAPYFTQMQSAAAAVPELVPLTDDAGNILPQSTFQQRFVAAGAPIYRLVLRKSSPGM